MKSKTQQRLEDKLNALRMAGHATVHFPTLNDISQEIKRCKEIYESRYGITIPYQNKKR